jgi:hypothetical protein
MIQMIFTFSEFSGSQSVAGFKIGHRRNHHYVPSLASGHGRNVRRSCTGNVEKYLMGVVHFGILVY